MSEWLFFYWDRMVLISYQTSFVIVFVLLARMVFQLLKMPRKYSYFLWFIPFLRLLIPQEIESSFSILPEASRGIPMFELRGNTPVLILRSYGGGNAVSGVDEAVQGLQQSVTMSYWERMSEISESLLLAAAVVWLTGIAVFLIYSMVSAWRLKKRLGFSVREKENIYLSDHISTAFVMGMIKTKIYLPSDISEEMKSYVIAHEKQHIARKDHIVKILAYFITCIYWMCPFVWLAFFYFQKDMEFACDEAVIAGKGNNYRKEYAAALLELSVNKKNAGMIPLAFSEKSPRKRIENIASYKKPGMIIGAVGVIVILVSGIGLLTTPQPGEAVTEVLTVNRAFEESETEEGSSKAEAGIDLNGMSQEAGIDLNGMSQDVAVLEPEKVTITEIPVTPPEVDLNASTGADGAMLYYVDKEIIIFGGYFGLFVYSKPLEQIIGALDLKVIGCDATQGDNYCEVRVLEDGSQVFLHPLNENNMYVYDVAENKLYLESYDLTGKKLYQKKEVEYGIVEYEAEGETHRFVLTGANSTLRHLGFYEDDNIGLEMKLLDTGMYPGAEYFEPEDFYDLVRMEFEVGADIYGTAEADALKWVEEHFSRAKYMKGYTGCPFVLVYFTRKDGTVGKVHVTTDSCTGFNTTSGGYDYRENEYSGVEDNSAFWGFFGDGYKKYMKLYWDVDV